MTPDAPKPDEKETTPAKPVSASKKAREEAKQQKARERERNELVKAAQQQVKLHARMDAEEAKRLQKQAEAILKRAEERQTFSADLAKHQDFVESLAPKMGFDPQRPVVEIPPLPDGYQELEFQTYKDGMAHVRIALDPVKNQLHYEVIEPQLSEIEQRALDFLRDTLIRTMAGRHASDQGVEEYLDAAMLEAIRDHAVLLDDVGTQRVRYHLQRDFLGFGPVDIMMHDAMLEDISCDGPGIPLYIFHRQHESIRTNVVFPDDATLDAYVIRLAQQSGKHISVADPLLDATLPDGSRLQATLSKEVTTRGSSFTVRRFRAEPLTPIHLMEYGTFNSVMASYFWLVMEHGMSILLAGGTASGKTTSLNAVCQFIPPQKKVVSIEDTREINLQHENWIAGVTRSGFGTPGGGGNRAGTIDMYSLLGAALRQRPEYLLVGEVRGPEALTLFQAMATGHAVYSTMHADSVTSAVYRLENEPINVPRLMLQTLDVVAIQTQVRVRGHMARRLAEVTEVVGFDADTGDLLTNQVFDWNPAEDRPDYLGKSYVLEHIAQLQNRTEQDVEREWEDRARIIEWMQRTGIRRFDQVTDVVSQYYRNPTSIMAKVEANEKETGQRPRLNLHPGDEPPPTKRLPPQPDHDEAKNGDAEGVPAAADGEGSPSFVAAKRQKTE